MAILLGCAAFALFFCNDWNDWKAALPGMKFCFPAGALLLAAATALGCGGPLNPWALAGAALFLALLVYTLFFALPAKAAYTGQGTDRAACTAGVYALCRHPGVLWFAGAYLCLSAGAGLPLWHTAVYTALNVGLVRFEDCRVFPARLAGYEQYRQQTPFLIPTARSVRECLKHGARP